MEKHPDKNKPSDSSVKKVSSRVGKILLGGNTLQSEIFSGRPSSVFALAETLPKLSPKKETRIWGGELAPGVSEGGDYNSILAIILAGDTAVAITRKAHLEAPHHLHISFVQLPYGEHGSDNTRTGKLLTTIYPEALNSARPDSIIQPWETINFGRSENKGGIDFHISDDPTVSRLQYSVTVGSHGDVSVTDKSLNGTCLITEGSINQGADARNHRLMSLQSRLADPNMVSDWDGKYNQHATIVHAQQ